MKKNYDVIIVGGGTTGICAAIAAATGEAAGKAAAISLKNGKTPRELAADKVVAQLLKDRDIEPAFE